MTAGAAPPAPALGAQLRALGGQSLVYGSADAFAFALNVLLLPVYSSYLSAAQYGALALLLLFGSLAKIVVRLGLDAGFFRVHYDLEDEGERRRLAGTAALFSALAAALFLALVALLRGPLTRALFGGGEGAAPAHWVVLVAADVSLGALLFVPLNLLRIQDRPRLFSALSVFRHGLNAALKVWLLARGGGVEGVLWGDLLSTGALVLAVLPLLRGQAVPALSRPLLREMLGFGLPKVPHGLMVQVQNLADRKVLDLFVTRAEVGLYHVGYTIGGAVKFALSAFEPAWGPFVYSRLRQPDAPRTLARVASWAFAAFVLAALGVSVFAGELLALLTPRNPTLRAGAVVVPVVALAYLLHGLFLLTSVGIGVARAARRYPLITAAAAAVNLLANVVLIPRLGILGAAWATVLSYACMAGLGYALARRLYPIPFEGGRLLRIALAGALAYALSLLAPAALLPRLAVKLAAVGAFPALLWALGEWRARRPGLAP
ncbi:MAG TPA: polysaccharide biosynthesis C-terminal domain-containing protein [Vicinamibacteria bacterium]|nr:polysaccharide biosynthesis C-terminal domain-containing protein [Vicinamibacteria bacterium]